MTTGSREREAPSPAPTPTLRRALCVLFARLLAGPPDPEFYARLRQEGFLRLAATQGLDLTSDLLDETDAEGSAQELRDEYELLIREVSLRASDFNEATEDPVVALDAFLREHGLVLDRSAGIPVDHISVVLGILGELSEQHERSASEESRVRAASFLHRHLLPWADRALIDWAAAANLHFYRGLATMVSAFLEVERRTYGSA